MTSEEIKMLLLDKATLVDPIGKTLKFDLGDRTLFVDGTGEMNEIIEKDADADCTVVISPKNFTKLIAGELNPFSAMMTGKLKIKGDKGVAMKLIQFV